jgi:hypothetical protein
MSQERYSLYSLLEEEIKKRDDYFTYMARV